ncbi:MAG: hypothetical protein CL933_17025 [Deltaproteobacteria bacterium]|nr:hypothetical protein [Deltaproteobacteria bacterium]
MPLTRFCLATTLAVAIATSLAGCIDPKDRRPSSTIRIFSSGENFGRLLRRISRTAASVDCFFWIDLSTRSLASQTPECVS